MERDIIAPAARVRRVTHVRTARVLAANGVPRTISVSTSIRLVKLIPTVRAGIIAIMDSVRRRIPAQ